jgi:ABC-type uncharacterized transport system ATPase subunit
VAILELNALHKSFGGLKVLDGFSLSLESGSLNALVGPNGCGKSTLFNLISGGLKPDSGTIRFQGQDIAGLDPHKIARLGIGRKFQVPAVFEELTPVENLTIAAGLSRHTNDILLILDQIKLTPRAQNPAGELSHGQKQWLEIGILLAQRPTLILLDEPTAGMTAPETRATAELILHIRNTGITVLVIEHDMGFIEHLNCPLHVMSKGKILKTGDFMTIRQDEDVKELYFGRAETKHKCQPHA